VAQHCLVVQAVLVRRCGVSVLWLQHRLYLCWIWSTTHTPPDPGACGCPQHPRGGGGCGEQSAGGPDGSHALDKPQTEVEQWLNPAWWFKQSLSVTCETRVVTVLAENCPCL
jgi:hypothetical protein